MDEIQDIIIEQNNDKKNPVKLVNMKLRDEFVCPITLGTAFNR